MQTVVILPEKLDTAAQTLLIDAFDMCVDGDVSVDASGVELMGARCLELLISAGRTIRDAGHGFCLVDASQRCGKDMTLLGLSPESFNLNGNA